MVCPFFFYSLIVARNVLLFTLLLDDSNSITPRDLWDMYHSFYLDAATFELICQQSKKLINVSKSLPSWNKAYGEHFSMINKETLKAVRRFWRNFCDPQNSESDFIDEFRRNVKDVLRKGEQISDFHRFCGAKSLFLQKKPKSYLDSTKIFWQNNTVNPSSDLPYCNPLFFDSEGAGFNFSLNPHLNPISGYHLVTSLSELTPDSPFRQQRQGRDMLELASEAAKIQFNSWSSAFRRMLREKRKFLIRFFVGDPLSLCIVINQHASGQSQAHTYVRAWSSQMFNLHDNCIKEPIDPPISYNVIDAGYLIDNIGLLNLLPRVIPLLKPTKSVLYTSTNDAEVDLEKLVCGDFEIMCTLLGITPTDHLTRVTTMSNNRVRIPWRPNTSRDPLATVEHSFPTFASRDLAMFAFKLHSKMFAKDISNGELYYTPYTFAAFLGFIKGRLHDTEEQVQWQRFVNSLKDWLGVKKDAGQDETTEDLADHVLLCSVSDWEGDSPEGTGDDPKATSYRHDHGVLKRQHPPEIIAIVVTVPRAKVEPIYNYVYANGYLNCFFEIYLSAPDNTSKFKSIHPVFGTLTPAKNGESGTIQEDVDGWYGSSDLQLCTYVNGALCLRQHPRDLTVSVRLSGDITTHEALKAIYGDNLEVFKAKFLNHQAVHLFEALPGLESPDPPITVPAAVAQELAFEENSESIVLHFPHLDFERKEFVLLVAYLADDKEKVLKQKRGITVNQISPSTVRVTCNGFEQVCTFPYPVTDIQYEVVPKLESIKITAPLMTIPNQYSSNPFPVLRHNGEIYNWNLPYINFRKLPKIDTAEEEVEWLNPHLTCMFSDGELFLRGTSFDVMTNIKNAVHAMFFYSVVRLKPSYDDTPIVFFFTGHYHDFNSNSLVAEAYVWPMAGETDLPVEAADIPVNEKEMKFWRSLMPALVERCREFEHTPSCEYASGIPVSLEKGTSSICSCGVGKIVGNGFQELLGDDWTQFQPYVTRVAVSTIFAPSYIEPTKSFSDAYPQGRHEKLAVFRHFGPITPEAYVEAKKFRCRVCWRENARKCVKCKEVAYCSKGPCQNKDWKEHKKYCKTRSAA